MLTWNIGNTTARNPARLRPALQLFMRTMSGRPFGKPEQQEFLNELIAAGMVDSDRTTGGSDGGRKFASAFLLHWRVGTMYKAFMYDLSVSCCASYIEHAVKT